jgi:glycosyltransferase involved in cell wall biosynthesis
MSWPHCLIFERDVTGHRLHHVRHLTEALLEVGCNVTIALQSDARSRDEYNVHLQPLEPDFQLRADLNPRQSAAYFAMARRVTELEETIASVRPDWVYLPYADVITQVAAVRALLCGGGILGRTPIEGQVMRGRYAYPSTSLRQSIGSAASRWVMQHSPWLVTHLLDTWVFNNLRGAPSLTEFRLIPEPVEALPPLDQAAARRALGVPVDGRYVATAGLLEPRKGIDLLLAAFAQAKLQPDDRLLLIGRMHPTIKELIARRYASLVSARRLIAVDRYVSDFELGCGFLAGDVLVTPHPHHVGSSGTLVRAAAANRKIIASKYGWVGWATKHFDLGAAVNVADPAEFAAAIESTLLRAAWPQGDKTRRFCQYHTVENQKAHWLVSLGRAKGLALGSLSKRIDWDWVMAAN